MKPSLALALAAAVLPAQDKNAAATPADLPRLRAAFATDAAGDRMAVLAVMPGTDPVILTAGSDAGGKELSPRSLLPLLSFAKLLAADAMYTQMKDRLDRGTGWKLGEHDLTLRELLEGTALLPDLFVAWHPDAAAPAISRGPAPHPPAGRTCFTPRRCPDSADRSR